FEPRTARPPASTITRRPNFAMRPPPSPGRGLVSAPGSREVVALPARTVFPLSSAACRLRPARQQFAVPLLTERMSRSFEELSPQNFSFNSPLGWCSACQGLGTEQGTNLSALIPNPERSLLDGAVLAWPDPQANP